MGSHIFAGTDHCHEESQIIAASRQLFPGKQYDPFEKMGSERPLAAEFGSSNSQSRPVSWIGTVGLGGK